MAVVHVQSPRLWTDNDRWVWSSGSSCAADFGEGDCLSWAVDCPLFSEKWSGDLRRRVSLAPLTTLGVGGPAAVIARPQSLKELIELVKILDRRGCPRRVMGRGSNVLVADRGYAGVVILMERGLGRITRLAGKNDLIPVDPVSEEKRDGEQRSVVKEQRSMGRGQGVKAGGELHLVRVEAGCSLATLLGWALKEGLGGLEFLAGIPARVGGAVMMNAGAWGESLSDKVHSLAIVSDGRLRLASRDEVCFSYRRLQGLLAREVVGAVSLVLTARDPAEIRTTMRRLLKKRRTTQPRGVASAGSFFKNPPGDFAGRLIEQAGLKGARVGGAEVSPVHANFLVNLGKRGEQGGACAADLLALMELVQEKVRARSGVELEPEVHFLGFEQP